MSDIVFACPACTAPLDDFTCRNCRREYALEGGIYRFMLPGRTAELRDFLDQYCLVREREGYQVLSTEQYRALPLVEHGPMQADLWRVRRESFEHMTAL